MTLLWQTASLLLPLLGGGIMHGFIMKHNALRGLATPIDGGRTWRGVRLFGDNKTWRGPVAVGLGSALVFALQAWATNGDMAGVYSWTLPVLAWTILGFAYGFIAMLGELPNSFLKRRAGITPGAAGGGRYAGLFYIYDQVDLLVAVLPLWWILGAFTWGRMALALVLVTVLHQGLSSVTFRLGMRKTPR